MDRKVLTFALKGTSDQLKDHFFATMSGRAVEMLKDDIEAMGPVKIKDVHAAQQRIVDVVRKLEEEGIINLGGSRDEYVV